MGRTPNKLDVKQETSDSVKNKGKNSKQTECVDFEIKQDQTEDLEQEIGQEDDRETRARVPNANADVIESLQYRLSNLTIENQNLLKRTKF